MIRTAETGGFLKLRIPGGFPRAPIPSLSLPTITKPSSHQAMTTSETMRGLQIIEFNKNYQYVTNIPVPKIVKPNEVLIKVAVAGYCHSEVMVLNGEFAHKLRAPLPLIPSHEGTGIVAEIGSQVTNVKVGDRVGTLTFKNICGTCFDCKNDLARYCEHSDMLGLGLDGAAAEYMVADSDWIVHIPSNLDFEAAAPLMCAGATIYCGIKQTGLKPGETLAIIGAGALGHLGVQFAKCLGLKVVCVDTRQAPLDLVKSLKYPPDFAIDATKGVEYALSEIGGSVDAVITATHSLAANEYGLKLVRKHGTFVAIGLPSDPIPIHYNHLVFRNIHIKGSLLSSTTLAQEMVNLVAEKGIEVKTKAYPLEDFQTLLDDYEKANHAGKLVLRVSSD